jgi:uncharacterized protein YecE (DUF72 family)
MCRGGHFGCQVAECDGLVKSRPAGTLARWLKPWRFSVIEPSIHPIPLHIGTCAWSFDDWRGAFYPVHLPASERLAFYSRHLPAVEIDSTFYHPPAPHVVAHWAEITPAHFRFTAKLPRTITHERKLRESLSELESFVEAMRPLGEKLVCMLVQLPPFFSLKHDEHALREFVRHLPAGARYAIEFRDPAWHLPRIAHLLEEHRVCWVWNDLTGPEHSVEGPFGFWPQTTDLIYLRLLGDIETKYHGDGSRIHRYRALQWPRPAALESWATKLRALHPAPSRIVVAVNNHYEGFSPQTAVSLAWLLGMRLELPDARVLTGADDRQLDLL